MASSPQENCALAAGVSWVLAGQFQIDGSGRSIGWILTARVRRPTDVELNIRLNGGKIVTEVVRGELRRIVLVRAASPPTRSTLSGPRCRFGQGTQHKRLSARDDHQTILDRSDLQIGALGPGLVGAGKQSRRPEPGRRREHHNQQQRYEKNRPDGSRSHVSPLRVKPGLKVDLLQPFVGSLHGSLDHGNRRSIPALLRQFEDCCHSGGNRARGAAFSADASTPASSFIRSGDGGRRESLCQSSQDTPAAIPVGWMGQPQGSMQECDQRQDEAERQASGGSLDHEPPPHACPNACSRRCSDCCKPQVSGVISIQHGRTSLNLLRKTHSARASIVPYSNGASNFLRFFPELRDMVLVIRRRAKSASEDLPAADPAPSEAWRCRPGCSYSRFGSSTGI